MKNRSLARAAAALALALSMSAVALGDVIRLKDGQVIRGEIVAFRDQQFTVLIGSGARGRRSRVTVYIEDIDSIEFDSAAGGAADSGAYDTAPAETARPQPTPARPEPTPQRQTERQPPTLGNAGGTTTGTARTNNTVTGTGAGMGSTPGGDRQTTPAAGGEASAFFPVRVRVRADNSANGWTDSGLMVRKGQRLRITASGRVSLGLGRFSTPTGLPRVMDTEKLMRNEPTGALIAVIGDDNDEFIFVGSGREFFATRDGRLFLGVNEGKLDDNTGTYDALIEAEPVTAGGN
ncbi:MAG TPA: hypothetical protein VD968_05420 [Pyrinomonadaceae bacterium]|nr:hypothetical protein [Pyrinomonadaceae bacterium]